MTRSGRSLISTWYSRGRIRVKKLSFLSIPLKSQKSRRTVGFAFMGIRRPPCFRSARFRGIRRSSRPPSRPRTDCAWRSWPGTPPVRPGGGGARRGALGAGARGCDPPQPPADVLEPSSEILPPVAGDEEKLFPGVEEGEVGFHALRQRGVAPQPGRAGQERVDDGVARYDGVFAL